MVHGAPSDVRIRTILFASLLVPVVALAQQGSEPVLLEARIGSVASAILLVRRSGDDVLLPRAALLALAGLATPSSPDSTDRFIPLDSARALLRERMEVDWEALVLTISDSHGLPVSRRAARAARRAALWDADSSICLGVRAPMAPRTILLDYSIAGAPGSARGLDGALRVGSGALGGSLGATWSPRTAVAVSWLRPIDSRFVRQLRVGDVQAAPITAPLRDAVILGNAPPVRDLGFGTQEITGTASPGTDVEILSRGELVAWTTTDAHGRYRVDVPLTYGANSVSVVARDSAGEDVRLEHRDILVTPDMLPAHSLEYTLADGRCASARCRHASIAEVRLALSNRLTISTTGAMMHDSAGPMTRSELRVVSRVRDAIVLSTRATSDGPVTVNVIAGASPNAMSGATLRWRPARDTQAAHRGALSGSGALDWLPFATPRVAVHMSGAFAESAALWRARASITLAGAGFRMEPFVHAVGDGAVHSTSLVPGVAVAGFGGRHVPGALHARIDHEQRVLATSVFAHGIALDASVTWRSATPRPTLRLSVARRTAAGRYATTMLRDADAPPMTMHTFDGSLIADLAHARVSSVSHTGAGALRGHVFVDVNHNGVFDPGEPTVADAALTIGGIHVETDARGEYTVWGLAPFTPLVLRIESLPAPYAQRDRPFRVELLPDAVATLDVAVARE